MFTIMNTKTGKFVYGTDYRYHPPRQRTSNNKMLTYENLWEVKHDFLYRKCGKNYKIAVLKTVEVKRLVDTPKSYDDMEIADLSETD